MSHMPEPTSDQQQSNRPNFPKMEEEIGEFWKKKNIFQRSIEERPENKTFVFYDGPPFATGLPHPGHLLQSAIKDAVPRYKTMQGYRVPRRWGWDCHGLPVESLIQKELKLGTKKDIEEYGIGAFNEKCAASVLQYTNEWRRYVERVGRWVDMDSAYKTMDTDYIESVWWAFAELWEKKLIYKDLRVSLYSPVNGTPLSNFEVAMENSYVDMEDPSITVKFPVVGKEKTSFLAWTTTPWSLPGNVALVVHPKEMYVTVRVGDENFIVAEKLLSNVFREFFPLKNGDAEFEILEKQPGSALVGMAYEPPFRLSGAELDRVTERAGKNLYTVVDMEYVSMSDGTGIVHTAPAFGEEDFLASKTHELPVLGTLDDAGNQVSSGEFYLDSNETILSDLKSRRLLYREEKITHSVAIFARNNTRLIYKAQPAWYVNVTKLKSKLGKTAEKINWHPEHLKEGRFGKGLETAPDWCISRSRFWGAPLPVWSNADGTDVRVFGTIADLEKASGVKIDRKHNLNMHRPAIDGIVFTNSTGEEMRRIPDVFDCWFESGSMPYASLHYPMEHRSEFDDNYPGDFIAEGQDQTRGWFYVLHVLSTALFGKPAFKDVICTGLIMAEDGRKMSKSLKNYADPWDVMTTVGADAFRLYMLSSPVVEAEQLNFSVKDCETVQRTVFGTLWNVRAFYLLFAEGQNVEFVKPKSAHVLDRWLLSRLASVTKEMTDAMENYDLVGATRPIRGWIDDLSTWWLRRSRDRMKGENEYEKLDALRTLREALMQTSLLLAPFAPFFAEKLYQDVNGSKMSVHLDKWPKADERIIDEQLLNDMTWVRAVVASAHEARVAAKMPVRQALSSLTVNLKDGSDAKRLGMRSDLMQLIREEVNVEDVILNGGADTGTELWTVVLDTELTPELKRKGLARELSRHIMNARKKRGLQPQDTIALTLGISDAELREQIQSMAAEIGKDVRASVFEIQTTAPETCEEVKIDGKPVCIAIG